MLKSYNENIKIISEPDHGIYDAINKGISIAEGDIIGILNSDDFYIHDKVLTNVCDLFKYKDIETCYGDLVYVDQKDHKKIIRVWKAGKYDINNFYWQWMPPHKYKIRYVVPIGHLRGALHRHILHCLSRHDGMVEQRGFQLLLFGHSHCALSRLGQKRATGGSAIAANLDRNPAARFGTRLFLAG